MTKTRYYREQLGFTQLELAEKAGLSLRTIQRLESGNTIPRGHTLNVLSETLNVDKQQLLQNELLDSAPDLQEKSRLRLLNLSILSFFGVPYGNLILPILIWRRNVVSDFMDDVIRRIINMQIIWSIVFSISLILAPFIQRAISVRIPLIIIVLIVGYAVNVLLVMRAALSINQDRFDFFNTRLRFL